MSSSGKNLIIERRLKKSPGFLALSEKQQKMFLETLRAAGYMKQMALLEILQNEENEISKFDQEENKSKSIQRQKVIEKYNLNLTQIGHHFTRAVLDSRSADQEKRDSNSAENILNQI